MALPKYTRRTHKPARERLPKDAYVVVIKDARVQKWPSGSEYIEIAFDIAEGDYAGFYTKQFNDSKNGSENAIWPYDARFTVDIPNEKSEQWVWTRYDEFFTAIEDSNDGYVFASDLKNLKGKLVGGKFRNEHKKGYDNVKLKWTCSADSVRSGEAARYMPKDYDDGSGTARKKSDPLDGFVNVPKKSDADEIPFD